MQKLIVTPEGDVVNDTPDERLKIFNWAVRWSGTEFCPCNREEVAPRYAFEFTDDRGQKIFKLAWQDRESNPTATYILTKWFYSFEAAENWCAEINRQRAENWCNDPKNFAFLQLPDGVQVRIGSMGKGQPYPDSRTLPVNVELPSAELACSATFRWRAMGATDDWLPTGALRDFIVDLLGDLMTAEPLEEDKPFSARKVLHDPDLEGSSEYRAIYEALDDCAETEEEAIAICEEFVERAQSIINRIRNA